MKDRNCIEQKYVWNLDRFYKNISDIEQDIEKIKKLNDEIVALRGKLNTSDTIFSYYKLSEDASILSEKVESYVFLRLSLNGKDAEALKLSSMLEVLFTKLSMQTAFVPAELNCNSDEFYLDLLKEKRFAEFDRDILDIIRERPHIAGEEKEKLLSGVAEFSNQEAVFDALDNVDLKFEPIKMQNGELKELTNANYVTMVADDEQIVRKQAFENLHKVFAEHNMSLSANFISKIKKSLFFAKQYNFKGTIESKFFGDEMPEKVLNVLVDAVNAELKSYQNYFLIRKNALKLKNYYIYDNYAPIATKTDIYPSYENAIDIFKEVVKPLGDRYWNYVNFQVNNRYVDVFETKNKDSGAFNADLNVCNPYVLLNYEPSLHWLGTLAHEFGHMVNTCLINDSQPFAKRGSTIFTAEIASTVNECLLYNYLIKTSSDKKFKLFVLDKFISEFNATVFRQTMFTEFELFAHKKCENEEPIMFEDLNNCYADLQKKYFGKSVLMTDNAKFEWSRIPHFYRPFYVYSYATGFISAVIIANKIEKEGKKFVDKYIEFLSSGTSDTGYNTLKKLGIDILDANVYKEAFDVYKQKINELKALLEEKC